jgi:transposase, IS30 family
VDFFYEVTQNYKWSAYKIAKVINRPINTALREILRGTVTQIKFGQKVDRYFENVGERVYNTSRSNCKIKDFLNFVNEKVSKNKWSLDACFGEVLTIGHFQYTEVVCTKIL